MEEWKYKQLTTKLKKLKGSGCSCISLLIPAASTIARAQQLLSNEFTSASFKKSRFGRLSILSAISSATQRLMKCKCIPKNGLALFCGTIVTDEGKEKKINADFEPPFHISEIYFFIDSKFHLEALESHRPPLFGIVSLKENSETLSLRNFKDSVEDIRGDFMDYLNKINGVLVEFESQHQLDEFKRKIPSNTQRKIVGVFKHSTNVDLHRLIPLLTDLEDNNYFRDLFALTQAMKDPNSIKISPKEFCNQHFQGILFPKKKIFLSDSLLESHFIIEVPNELKMICVSAKEMEELPELESIGSFLDWILSFYSDVLFIIQKEVYNTILSSDTIIMQ